MSDTISRQAVIDTLTDMPCKSDEDGYVWIIRSDAWARIDSLPPAQSEQQWVPCSERPPEEGEEVLCQCVAGIKMVLKYIGNGEWYQDVNHTYMRGFVLAWMSLPESYKEI